MKNTPLYICDDDTVYLDRLSGYIMKKDRSPFLIKTVSDMNYWDMNEFKDGLLLISSSLLREEMQALDAHRMVILNEGEVKKEFENFMVVNKFQPASAIYEKLIACQMSRADIVCVSDGGNVYRKLKIYGVYSPVRRIGKSAFVRKKCQEEGAHNRVLLLNLEELSKYDEEGAGLSEVIYFYKQKKFSLVFGMAGVIRQTENYDYILPVRWAWDLKDMTAKDWVDVFSEIEKENMYDQLWIDFDGIGPGIEIFERCEAIYVPFTDDAWECRRITQFEKILEMMPEYGISEKIVKIQLEA